MNKKKTKKYIDNIIPVIRGINLYNIYKKKNINEKIKIYIKYVNNIKILLRYKEKVKNKLFIKLIRLCYKNYINLTISFKFYSFKKIKIFKYIRYIKYIIFFINNIKKIKSIFIDINYQCNNIYEWYNFYKKLIYLCRYKKIYNFIFINYSNNFKYLNNIILLKIIKLFKIFFKNKIFLLISLYKKIFRIKNKVIQFINCFLNKNIFIILSEISNIDDLEYILNFCFIKKISWWITPSKKNNKNKSNKKNIKINFFNISSIIYRKNGIRQTSIKKLP